MQALPLGAASTIPFPFFPPAFPTGTSLLNSRQQAAGSSTQANPLNLPQGPLFSDSPGS